jgi:hypothetical protein
MFCGSPRQTVFLLATGFIFGMIGSLYLIAITRRK